MYAVVTPVYGDPDVRVFSSTYQYLGGSTQSGADTVKVANPGPGTTFYIQVPVYIDTTYTIGVTEGT